MKKKVMISWLINEYKLTYQAMQIAVEAKSNFEGRLIELERIFINLFEIKVLDCGDTFVFQDGRFTWGYFEKNVDKEEALKNASKN